MLKHLFASMTYKVPQSIGKPGQITVIANYTKCGTHALLHFLIKGFFLLLIMAEPRPNMIMQISVHNLSNLKSTSQ